MCEDKKKEVAKDIAMHVVHFSTNSEAFASELLNNVYSLYWRRLMCKLLAVGHDNYPFLGLYNTIQKDVLAHYLLFCHPSWPSRFEVLCFKKGGSCYLLCGHIRQDIHEY